MTVSTPKGGREGGAAGKRTAVEVEGHRLTLSNLDKILFPDTGTTKREVLSYYTSIAPVMLPYLAGRPVTFRRAPDGVNGQSFYEKHLPRGAPAWVNALTVPVKGKPRGSSTEPGSGSGRSTKARSSEVIDYPAIDGLPALIWAANLAAIEFHVPMWRVDTRKRPLRPDLMVFDLDPGDGAGIAECCRVALWLRRALEDDGLLVLPKTSGSKGLQLYTGVTRHPAGRDTLTYSRELAQRVEIDHPGEVVSNMRRELRQSKVLIDWSQNNPSKTTVAPYSLRLLSFPSVSTPLTWPEVESAGESTNGANLRFTIDEVLARMEADGDPFAPLLSS